MTRAKTSWALGRQVQPVLAADQGPQGQPVPADLVVTANVTLKIRYQAQVEGAQVSATTMANMSITAVLYCAPKV